VARRVGYYDEDTEARYDVFINHRGLDTKRTVARLLYDRLAQDGVRGFLDNRSMRPGDRMDDRISAGIRECSVAVAIFSPSNCDSEYCLRELAMIVESRKAIIPIFYNIKPSDLILPEALADSDVYQPRELERFRFALREAKSTVGIIYDSATGYVIRSHAYYISSSSKFDRSIVALHCMQQMTDCLSNENMYASAGTWPSWCQRQPTRCYTTWKKWRRCRGGR
jgi:hypothetical protein